jgi:hypothetical protein
MKTQQAEHGMLGMSFKNNRKQIRKKEKEIDY